jgi:hypothetical protein
MLLYRQQRLLEEDQPPPPLSGEPPLQVQGEAPPLKGNARQEQAHEKVGIQDEVTAKNRKGWKTLQEGLAADSTADAEAMAALYLKVPGHTPPAPQNVIQAVADQRKLAVRNRQRVQQKTRATGSGARGAQLHPGTWRTDTGQRVTGKSNSPVVHRSHLPIQGSVAIV